MFIITFDGPIHPPLLPSSIAAIASSIAIPSVACTPLGPSSLPYPPSRPYLPSPPSHTLGTTHPRR
jgi:hypothetical protein